jgi:hypothetical protein
MTREEALAPCDILRLSPITVNDCRKRDQMSWPNKDAGNMSSADEMPRIDNITRAKEGTDQDGERITNQNEGAQRESYPILRQNLPGVLCKG